MPILSFFSYQSGNRDGDRLVFLTQEDQGNQVVIPEPQELENRKGCQSGN